MRKEIFKNERWIIEFETDYEDFYLFQIIEGINKEYGNYDTYKKCIDAIDRKEIIKKKKIKPLSFIERGYYNENYKEGIITSINEKTNYGLYLWTSVDKKRSKNSNKCLKNISENKIILNKIKELKNLITKENKKLIYFTDEEIKKHFEMGETK